MTDATASLGGHGPARAVRGSGRRPITTALLVALVVVVVSFACPLVRTDVDATGVRLASVGCLLTSGELTVDGERRTYRLCVPAKPSGPIPLVVALHGMAGSSRQMVRTSGLPEILAPAGVALVVPDARAGAWNDGRLAPGGPNDERFVLELVSRLVAMELVDGRRVTLTGFSNGADLALVLASRHPDAFASVVAVSGHLLARAGAARPTAPIPTYLVYGTADAVQPMVGRAAAGRLRPALLSASATAAAFVRSNAATRGASRSHDRSTGELVVTDVHPPGHAGAPVHVIQIVGGTHAWPRRGVDASRLVGLAATRYRR